MAKQTVDDVIDAFKHMTLSDVTRFVKAFEEEFGVSAEVAPLIVRDELPPSPEVEEQTHFDVVIVSSGEKKIHVIKAIREAITGLGLKEAKALVDSPPAVLMTKAPKAEAEAVKAKLKDQGATVELR